MEWYREKYLITDDKSHAEIDYIHRCLNTTYWAEGRARETIEKSIANSVFLSLFDGSGPIGFARIVSDWATFAWLCDVFIDPEYRGEGLGVWLVECAVNHPAMKVRNNMLATRDAHSLYKKFGFARREMMYRRGDK